MIPVEICTPHPMLRFYPHRQAKKMRFEPYREAWHLLQSQEDTQKKPSGKVNVSKIEIQAHADDHFTNLTWLTPRPPNISFRCHSERPRLPFT